CTCVTHRADSVTWMSSSSLSSRERASRTVSPGSIFPPGSSHQPDQGLSPGRSASKSSLLERRIRPAATSTNGLDMACGPVPCELAGDAAGAGAALKGPLKRFDARFRDALGRAAMHSQPVIDDVEVVVLLEGIEGQPQAEAL